MSGYQFLLALRARLGVFALALVATTAATAIASLLLPKSYRATVSLLVDAKDEQSLGNALRPLLLPQERISYLQTQVDIITSGKVARKVVEDLKLARLSAFRAAFERAASNGSIEEWLAADLLRRLKVETSQSNVIQATFSAGDAAFAAQVANAFAKAYIDTMLELRVEPTREAARWFDEQLKGLRANLEEAQKNLTDYYVDAGGSLESLPDVLDNPFIQRLKADLLHSEARLQELATQYGPNHPQYQRQVTESQSLRAKLALEMRKVVVGNESAARQSRQRPLRFRENRNQLTVLRRNVESAERAYDTAMQRYVVSRVDSRASQTNVTVLNPAAVPDAPFRPRLALNLALSVLAGTALGIGLVLMLEMADRRLRSAAELERGWNLPLLAALGDWQPAQRALRAPSSGARALPSPG